MPVPVSVTAEREILAGRHVVARGVPARRANLLWVSMVMRPPSGIASRALMQRFSSAFSSCGGSTSAGHSPVAPTTSMATEGPTVRRMRSSMPETSVLTSVARGSSVCRREKASRRCVSAAARRAAPGRGDHVAVELGDPALRDAQGQQLEAAGYAGEQVVEVVRQAAGELAHRFHLLRLAHHLFGFRALGHLGFELPRPLRDALLQGRVQLVEGPVQRVRRRERFRELAARQIKGAGQRLGPVQRLRPRLHETRGIDRLALGLEQRGEQRKSQRVEIEDDVARARTQKDEHRLAGRKTLRRECHHPVAIGIGDLADMSLVAFGPQERAPGRTAWQRLRKTRRRSQDAQFPIADQDQDRLNAPATGEPLGFASACRRIGEDVERCGRSGGCHARRFGV